MADPKPRYIKRTLTFLSASTQALTFDSVLSTWAAEKITDTEYGEIDHLFNSLTIRNNNLVAVHACVYDDIDNTLDMTDKAEDGVELFNASEERTIDNIKIKRLRVYCAGAGTVDLSLFFEGLA